MAKKKTNMHGKPDALQEDPRTNMYRGKDRVTTSEEEDTTETEDPSVEASMEATPEVTGFMDSKNSNQDSKDGIMGGETEVQYKKRYDDLKTYYDKKLSEWKQEKETLEAQSKVAEKQVQYAPPKTEEDLEQFKDKYPDVYQVVETISHKMAASQVEDLQAEIGRLSEREQKLKVQSAFKQLLHTHPDFNEIKSSSEFLTWLEQQPTSISEGITKNNTDPVWASRTVDLYKADVGIDGRRRSTKSKDAARAVTKATSRDVNVGQNDRTWKMSEIQKLKPWEFEKYESEIDQAMRSGRVINE
tara:strand:+ start:777 stop:1679 length:903 start_codon:yes stop_codon:yes gene_type:complete